MTLPDALRCAHRTTGQIIGAQKEQPDR